MLFVHQIHGHYSKETRKYHWGETLQDAYYKDYEHPEVYSTALINGMVADFLLMVWNYAMLQ